MPHRLIRSRIFWTALALWVGFLPAYWILPTRELFELLNALVISVSLGVLYGFSKTILSILPTRPRDLQGSHALILGTMTVLFGLVIVFGNLWAWRVHHGAMTDDPEAIINHWSGAFGRWVIVTGGTMLLASSGAIDDLIPPASYMRAGAWVALGFALAAVAMTFGIR